MWSDPRLRLGAAYALVAIAVFIGNGGGYEGVPLVVAAFGLVLATLSRTRPARPAPPISDPALVRLAVIAAVVLALLSLARTPGLSLAPGTARWPFWLATFAIAGVTALGAARPRYASALVAMIALLYLGSGALLLHASPAPHIDVFTLQSEAARFLSAGTDPYTARFTNIYSPEDTLRFFGDTRTDLANFPYPPASLLLTTASFCLGGDVRIILLLAQVAIGLLLYRLARSTNQPPALALALAALHYIHPRGLFVLEQSWTEPLLGCALVAVLLAARAAPGVAAVIAGIFLGLKQYSILAVPLLVAHRTGLARRGWVLGLAVAAGLTLPWMLWHPRAFIDDVVLFQMRQPLRTDSMSIVGILGGLGVRLPGAVSFVAAALALTWAWRRLPDGPSGLARGTALAMLAFFLTGKQAFCNYYYFVGVTLLGAAASAGQTTAER